MRRIDHILASLARRQHRNAYRGLHALQARLSATSELLVDKDSRVFAEMAHHHFVVAIVTHLEVFFREQIERAIDHTDKHLLGARELAKKHVKFDFDTIVHLREGNLTLGTLVGHSVSMPNIETILSIMSTLLNTDFAHDLKNAHNLYEVRVLERVHAPLISDQDHALAMLSQLFEVRHQIVHEIPQSKQARETPAMLEEIQTYLSCAAQLQSAADEVVSSCIFDERPLTQAEITQLASNNLRDAEVSLDQTMAELVKTLEGSTRDAARIGKLKKSQDTWEEYCKLHSEFVADEYEGGSIYPTIYCMEAEALTKQRQEIIGRLKAVYESIGDEQNVFLPR